MARHWTRWLAWSLLVAGAAHPQSLAEVAAKEKARRAKRDRAEPVRVIGDEELAEASSASVVVTPPSAVASSSETESSAGEETGEPNDDRRPRAGLSADEVRYYREAWNRVWAKQLAAAEKELERARYESGQCQAAAHYVFVPIAIDCHGVRERLAVARFQVEHLRRNRFNWELLLPERQRPPPPFG